MGEADYLALMSAGAYGFVMASNYNTRALAAEVLVHGTKYALVRDRQKLPDIWRSEKLPAWLKSPRPPRKLLRLTIVELREK